MKSILSRGDGRSKGRESMKKHDVLGDHLADSSVPSWSIWWCSYKARR